MRETRYCPVGGSGACDDDELEGSGIALLLEAGAPDEVEDELGASAPPDEPALLPLLGAGGALLDEERGTAGSTKDDGVPDGAGRAMSWTSWTNWTSSTGAMPAGKTAKARLPQPRSAALRRQRVWHHTDMGHTRTGDTVDRAETVDRAGKADTAAIQAWQRSTATLV